MPTQARDIQCYQCGKLEKLKYRTRKVEIQEKKNIVLSESSSDIDLCSTFLPGNTCTMSTVHISSVFVEANPGMVDVGCLHRWQDVGFQKAEGASVDSIVLNFLDMATFYIPESVHEEIF